MPTTSTQKILTPSEAAALAANLSRLSLQEKIEVKKTDLTEAEIDAKLREKLAKFMDVSDAEVIDVEEKPEPPAQDSDANDIDPENPDAE